MSSDFRPQGVLSLDRVAPGRTRLLLIVPAAIVAVLCAAVLPLPNAPLGPLALGVYLAPFSYSAKNELIEEHLVEALAIVATLMISERLLVKNVAGFAKRHERSFSSVSLFVSLVRIGVVIVGGLLVLQSLGIAIAPILTALGVGGLAVALALQTTLANLFAGIQIIAAQQMRPGDYVKLDDGSEGWVGDITWRTTVIRDQFGNLLVVPNGKLATATMTNYSLPDPSVVTAVPFTVRHGTPLEKIERLALETAGSVGKDPYVRFLGVTDSGIAVTAYFTVPEFGAQLAAKSTFLRRFYEQAEAQGMALPSQSWAELPPPPSPPNDKPAVSPNGSTAAAR